ncbi:MAG: hypothetical protein R8G66_34880 [Cytophagales bacterium]|nr:hypothetical protein [Cytophagales bacterium]
MKYNKFYTYLSYERDEEGNRYYGLYYKIDLRPKWATYDWVQNLEQVSRNVYKLELTPCKPGEERIHKIELEIRQNQADDNISRDGVIRIYGPPRRKRFFKESFELKIFGGPNNGNGATKHPGDADG